MADRQDKKGKRRNKFKRKKSGNFDSKRQNPDSKRPPHSANPLRGPKIDREKVCPFLIRVLPRLGSHHRLEEFSRHGQEPKDEIQVYTWADTTLRELYELVQEVNTAARRPSARISFAFIYPDSRGINVLRQVGTVHATRRGNDDDAALRDLKFETGDFLSVAIY